MIVNFLGFQVGWFACVLGAGRGVPWIGPGVILGLLLVHLARATSPWQELRLGLVVGALGWLLDTLQGAAGLLSFAESPFREWISPPWLTAMWVNFALTLRFSLRWLLGRYSLGALLGILGGPAAYYAGSRWGAIRLEAGWATSLLMVGCVWAVAVPLLLWLAARMDHHAESH